MDETDKNRILDALEKCDPSEPHTLILTVAAPPSQVETPPPSAFKDRSDYRRALIARRRDQTGGVVAHAAGVLGGLGLAAKPLPLTASIVVKGTPDQLRAALEESFIETAVEDTPIELIRPARPSH